MASITVGEATADDAEYRFRGELKSNNIIVAFTIVGARDAFEAWDRVRNAAQPVEGVTKRLAWLVAAEAMRLFEVREWIPTEGAMLRLE